LIKKLWVKFDGLDVACVCNTKDLDCRQDGCQEYVVKFTLIERAEDSNLPSSQKSLADGCRKITSALNTTARHIRNLKTKIK